MELILDTNGIVQNLREDDSMITIDADAATPEANLDSVLQMNLDIDESDFFNQADEINLDEEINDINNHEEEDYEFHSIKDHCWK